MGSDNADSVVLLLQYGQRRILLPGDLENPGTHYVAKTPPRQCDILMAPHHGSLSSNPSEIMNWSRPNWVIVSGGEKDNTQEIIEVYSSTGARVHHLNRTGAVSIRLNKDRISVNTFLENATED